MTIYPSLKIPNTIAAGPGPGNTDSRVLEAFNNAGVADHMQPDVLRGMRESKEMLRTVFGTKNIYTFGVAGTGFSGLDCAFSSILPGDKVVVFINGTFSGIDSTAIRMKASSNEDLAASPLNPQPACVTTTEVPHGKSVTGDIVEAALAEHKPMWAFMAHWETGSGRINDIQGFSDACEKQGVLGIVDAVSSLGIGDFNIDDYPGVGIWASCPQKGMLALPLTYAPVSFSDKAIEIVAKRGTHSHVHNPLLEARHWGVIEGKDVEAAVYHRTHSGYAVASFHEALRLLLTHGKAQKAADYVNCENILRQAVQAMGCIVTSNMPSLIVLDLPGKFAGSEKDLVGACRAENFCIWLTLSEPVQIRIGILNQLTPSAITEITDRFADAMLKMGAQFDKGDIMDTLKAMLEGSNNG